MSNLKPVKPMGSCVKSSFELFCEHLESGPNMNNAIRLCHGIGVSTAPGQEGMPIVHCWVEFFSNRHRMILAMDPIFRTAGPAKEFEDDFKCSYVVKYTHLQVKKLMDLDHSKLMWDPKILKAIKDFENPAEIQRLRKLYGQDP